MADTSPATGTTTPDPSLLLHHLQTETALVSSFIKVLQREAEILATGAQPEALDHITTEKNTHADKLGSQAQTRNQLLAAMGHAADRPGLLAAAGNHPQLLEAVHALLDGTEQARLLNLGNGQIIDRYLNHHGQALQVLHHLTGRSQLYDARGRTRPTTRPRTGHNKSA
ncbi:MAG TPA: flagellar protein FlgN [Burkholderiaceae bacterium]|nr:flagellar protein FlgN [Burkholderiaceae bacterium]